MQVRNPKSIEEVRRGTSVSGFSASLGNGRKRRTHAFIIKTCLTYTLEVAERYRDAWTNRIVIE